MMALSRQSFVDLTANQSDTDEDDSDAHDEVAARFGLIAKNADNLLGNFQRGRSVRGTSGAPTKAVRLDPAAPRGHGNSPAVTPLAGSGLSFNGLQTQERLPLGNKTAVTKPSTSLRLLRNGEQSGSKLNSGSSSLPAQMPQANQSDFNHRVKTDPMPAPKGSSRPVTEEATAVKRSQHEFPVSHETPSHTSAAGTSPVSHPRTKELSSTNPINGTKQRASVPGKVTNPTQPLKITFSAPRHGPTSDVEIIRPIKQTQGTPANTEKTRPTIELNLKPSPIANLSPVANPSLSNTQFPANSSTTRNGVKRTATGEIKPIERSSSLSGQNQAGQRSTNGIIVPPSTGPLSTTPFTPPMSGISLKAWPEPSRSTTDPQARLDRPPNGSTRTDPTPPVDILDARCSALEGSLLNQGVIAPESELKRTQFLVRHVGGRGASHGGPYQDEDDELIVYLKERAGVSWHNMIEYFPGRNTWHSLQSRYSVRLKNDRAVPRPWRSGPSTPHSETPSSPEDSPAPSQLPPRKSTRLQNSELSKPGAFTLPHVSNMQGFLANPLRLTHTPPPAQLNDDEGYPIAPTSHIIDDPEQQPGAEIARSRIGPLRRHPSAGYRGDSEYTSLKQTEVTRHHTSAGRISIDRLALEKTRDSAALVSMATKIHRAPTTVPIPPWMRHDSASHALRVKKRHSVDVNRPYLDHSERTFLTLSTKSCIWETNALVEWEGKAMHVDFLEEEIEQLIPSIQSVRRHSLSNAHEVQPWVAKSMENASQQEISDIANHVLTRGVFLNRTRDSIESYMRDLATGAGRTTTAFRTLGVAATHSKCSTRLGMALRNRELGHNFTRKTIGNIYDTLGPSLVFTGGSGDVQTVAWSPDNRSFAMGCAALMDTHSQQYNQRNNLLVGNIDSKTLRELPDHAIARPLTVSGTNSSQAMYDSQDPLLYSSISAVQFTSDGEALITAGYDKKVRIWDLRRPDGQPLGDAVTHASCTLELEHQAPIDIIAVSEIGLFATGAQRSAKSVKVMGFNLDVPKEETKSLFRLSLSSPKAVKDPHLGITPSCMRWGYLHGLQEEYMAGQAKYLACGFSSWSTENSVGELCVWDLEREQPVASCRGARSIFDLAWSPSSFGRLAIGASPGSYVNKGTRSVVQIFDSRTPPPDLNLGNRYTLEMECAAMDINDVVFNPMNELIVSAGCTNGRVYTWDVRKPDDPVHCFEHEASLNPLDEMRPAEEVDTGVRFLSWNQKTNLMYTGSSDGVVSAWNPSLAREDAHIKDIVQLKSGVMSGAFNSDFSNLLLGDVNGSIAVLSVGCEDEALEDAEQIEMRLAPKELIAKVQERAGIPKVDTSKTPGADRARHLLQSQEMQLIPFGDLPIRQAVQGPKYAGPYDGALDAPLMRAASLANQCSLRPSQNPCKLPHSLTRLTEEEQGDSQAWKTRVPARARWPDPSSNKHSGSEIRSMSCFRCGERALISRKFDTIKCTHCKRVWSVDVLGYTGFDFHDGTPTGYDYEDVGAMTDDPALFVQDDADLLGNVEAYHHSFWYDNDE